MVWLCDGTIRQFMVSFSSFFWFPLVLTGQYEVVGPLIRICFLVVVAVVESNGGSVLWMVRCAGLWVQYR